MAESISYKREDVEMIIRLLNSISVKGVENAKYIAVIHDKLANEGIPVEGDKGEQ